MGVVNEKEQVEWVSNKHLDIRIIMKCQFSLVSLADSKKLVTHC